MTYLTFGIAVYFIVGAVLVRSYLGSLASKRITADYSDYVCAVALLLLWLFMVVGIILEGLWKLLTKKTLRRA